MRYIINEFIGKDRELDNNEIGERFSELLTEFALEKLTASGLIEADFSEDETRFTVTEAGREYAKKFFPELLKDN